MQCVCSAEAEWRKRFVSQRALTIRSWQGMAITQGQSRGPGSLGHGHSGWK